MSTYDQPSPGREAPGGSPPPAADAPPSAPPAGEAAPGTPPAAEPPSLFSGPMLLLLALPILLIFLTSRSQAKKQQKLEQSIKQGDRVITRAGILGKVVDITERSIKVEIAPGVVVQVLKTAIEAVDNPEQPKDVKDAKDAKEIKGDDDKAKASAAEKSKGSEKATK